jgi:aspartate dehydrogenase
MPRLDSAETRRVGIVGFGNIGTAVAQALLAHQLPGLELAGVLGHGNVPRDLAVADLSALLDVSDIVVEAAGPDALRELTPLALIHDRTLIALSLGAFLEPETWPLLSDPDAGRLVLSTGAIGGIDLVRAARLADPEIRIHLRSRKRPYSLVQPWMDEHERARLDQLTERDAALTIFSGGPADAARLFPANLNVAAALAIAVGNLEAVTVDLVADPATRYTVHEVTVQSAAGEYQLTIANRPSRRNPATSDVVIWSVLRCLRDLSHSSARFL